MKKLFFSLFVAVVAMIIVMGAFQSRAEAFIGYCDTVCCLSGGECRDSATLCYCPGTTTVVNCFQYCEFMCSNIVCPVP